MSTMATWPRIFLQFEVESALTGRRTMKRPRFGEEQIIAMLKEQVSRHISEHGRKIERRAAACLDFSVAHHAG